MIPSEEIIKLKQRKREGYIRAIPTSIPAFNRGVGGIVKGEPITVIGFTSGGKSTFTRQIAVLDSIEYAIKNNINFKVLYFALEDSERQFDWLLYAYLVKKITGIRYGMREFECMTGEVTEEDLRTIKDAKIDELFLQYKSYIHWYDYIYNPYGIYKTVRDFAGSRGTFYDPSGNPLNYQTDISTSGKKFAKYSPDDPKEFITVVLDHIGLVTKEEGIATEHEAMSKIYGDLKKFACKVFDYAVIFVQQQDMQSTDLNHIQANMWMPGLNTGSKNKLIAADARIVIGIGDPTPFPAIREFEGFKISDFGELLRFVKILKQTYGGNRSKIIPVLLDGKCNHVLGLPGPTDKEINNYKQLVELWK